MLLWIARRLTGLAPLYSSLCIGRQVICLRAIKSLSQSLSTDRCRSSAVNKGLLLHMSEGCTKAQLPDSIGSQSGEDPFPFIRSFCFGNCDEDKRI